MSQIPPATILIALAMLAASVVIVSKIGGNVPLSKRAQAILLVAGGATFLVGVYLHLSQTPVAKPRAAAVTGQEKPASELFTFTFSPAQVRWGDQVEIQTPFPAESITVYLNGMPLPKRLSGDGRTIRVTIPSGVKTGYLDLERGETHTRASEPISISP